MPTHTHGVATVVMKNCDPLVFFPAFAIERRPGSVCFSLKFSSVVIIIRRQRKKEKNRRTRKLRAVYRLSTSTVIIGKISPLNHELRFNVSKELHNSKAGSLHTFGIIR